VFCGLWLDGGWALAFGAAAVLCPCRPFLSYGPKKRGDKLRDGQTVRQNKAEKVRKRQIFHTMVCKGTTNLLSLSCFTLLVVD